MELALPQLVNGVRPSRLWNKEPRRVKQEAVIYPEFTADRGLDP
jgi:hypothetical protein